MVDYVIRGSKEHCTMVGCSAPSIGLYFMLSSWGERFETQGGVKAASYWCKTHLEDFVSRPDWTPIRVEYHFCNPLCKECMKNPREVVRF